MITSVISGFDVELNLDADFVRYSIQLLMDAGVVPREVRGFILQPAHSETINRTYAPYENMAYPFESNDAWSTTFRPHPIINDDWILEVWTAAIPFDILIRLPEVLDVQALMQSLVNYFENDTAFNIFEFVDIIAIQDRLAEDDDLSTLPAFDLDEIRGIFTTALEELKKTDENPLLDFAKLQLNPLFYAQIDTVRFKIHDSKTLGVALNFVLLNGVNGILGSRGNMDLADKFITDDHHFGIGTRANFIEDFLKNAIFKYITQFKLDEELIGPGDIPGLIVSQFPIIIPKELFPGTEAIDIIIQGVEVQTVKRKDPRTGSAPAVDSLKLLVKTTETILKFLNVSQENLVIHAVPTATAMQGVNVSDIYLDTNVHIDVFRSLIPTNLLDAVLFPHQILSPDFLLTPFIALINAGINSGEQMIRGPLSELGITLLSQLPFVTKRWDPFYSTIHQLLLEPESFEVVNERIFMAGKVHLSTKSLPYERVFPRYISSNDNGAIESVMYKAEQGDNILLTEHAYATDRLVAASYPDTESHIYKLEMDTVENSVESRLAVEKLMSGIQFTPFCITENETKITDIGMLSEREVRNIRRRIERDFLTEKVNKILEDFEAVLGPITNEDDRKTIFDILYGTVKDSQEHLTYLEEQFAIDVTNKIYQIGTIRLRLSPVQLNKLGRSPSYCLLLRGYVQIVREGELYYRGIPNFTEEDNLLSLPNCEGA